MNTEAIRDFDEYQLSIQRNVLLLWGLILAIGALITTYWFTVEIGRTIGQIAVSSVMCIAVFVLRRYATVSRQRITGWAFTILISALLLAALFVMRDEHLILVAGALAIHAASATLIVPIEKPQRIGYGIAILYFVTSTVRVALSAQTDGWSWYLFFPTSTFPTFFIFGIGAVMSAQVNVLRQTAVRVKHLEGILPMCSYCRKIKDETGNWKDLERYIDTTTETEFSHVICPDCYPEVMSQIEGK